MTDEITQSEAIRKPPDRYFRALFAELAAPFDSDEVKVKSGAYGRQMHYVTARTVMNRLDDVLDPWNWWDEFPMVTEHSAVCRLTIRLPDGSLLTKSDIGGAAGMTDPGDDDKSAFADALKRAAVKFGVGRYLYRDGIPQFAREILRDRGVEAAVPLPQERSESSRQFQGREFPGDRGGDVKPPRTGSALWAWASKQDDDHGYGLINSLTAWGKRVQFPERIKDWTEEQVAKGYHECVRKIGQLRTEVIHEGPAY